MKKDTELTTLGRNPRAHAGTVNPPVYQTSTIVFPSLKAYRQAESGKPFYKEQELSSGSDFSYGLGGTPSTFALQDALRKLEGADHCLIYPSGLAAITFTLLSFLEPGDHCLISDSAYGPTRRFCNKELKRLGIETTYYDPLIGAGIDKLIKKNTKFILLESPGSLTFEMQDIPAIVKVAKKKGVITAMDNSWATPLYYQPIKHGVDLSIQAITKYIGGHADVILGSVACNKEHVKALQQRIRHFGVGVNPAECASALRGLRTLSARLDKHYVSAMQVAKWLQGRKEVSRVIYPALPGDAGHKIWKRDFSGACGLFTFILKKHYNEEQIANMIDHYKHFGIGASWGGYESLVVYFDPTSIRTATKWKAEGSAIRLHIGLEAPEDLIADLDEGFRRLSK
ncbi:MAG: cystathionine beta-lyase [Proteobacteria bacterium]|nr:cystathionine beta-lyase [Pseudomonadota bacterium]